MSPFGQRRSARCEGRSLGAKDRASRQQTVVGPLAAGRDGRLLAVLELFGRADAAVGAAAARAAARRPPRSDREALALPEGPLVPVDPQPLEAPQQPRSSDSSGRPLAVGVLDPQDKGAAVAARVGPAEERRAGAANVQEPRGAGGESGAHGGAVGRAGCHGRRSISQCSGGDARPAAAVARPVSPFWGRAR